MVINELIAKFGTSEYLGKDFLDNINTDPPGQSSGLYFLRSSYFFLDSINTDPPGEWGHLWHRCGEMVSSKYIREATRQIRTIIKNTMWKSDEHWWISQKHRYESFFEFKWDLSTMYESIGRIL